MKQYDLTVKINEATLYVSKTKFFQMSVFVRLKMKDHEEKKTASQSGQNPKWEETFVFPNIAQNSQLEFNVYHKGLFSSEELIGNATFLFENLYSYNLKKFITIYENLEAVGGLNITLSVKSRYVPIKNVSLPVKKQDDAPVAGDDDANTVVAG